MDHGIHALHQCGQRRSIAEIGRNEVTAQRSELVRAAGVADRRHDTIAAGAEDAHDA